MKILLVADTLLAGGAEWFILRIAERFMQSGCTVTLVVLRGDKVDQRIVNTFSNIQPVHASVPVIKLCVFADRVLNKLLGKPFAFHVLSTRWLRKLIKKLQPDVIHSHLLAADYIAMSANRKCQTKHIITVHGDYLEFLKENNWNRIQEASVVFKAVNKIVVITDEQRLILMESFHGIEGKLFKIYNGYVFPNLKSTNKSNGKFTFGMIARGNYQKGWAEAIEAFKKIDNKDVQLLLYGAGDFLNQLKKQNSDSRIIFAGFTNNPLDAVSKFDVGLFPSFYNSESLPTTIIEYLVLHKPVLTTAVGECAKMIENNGSLAGAVIPMKQGKPDVDILRALMIDLMNNREKYLEMSKVAEKAKQKFEMSRCIDRYLDIYKN